MSLRGPLSVSGGQRGGRDGAVWLRRRSAPGSRPAPGAALAGRERRAAAAAAGRLPALPAAGRRLPPSSRRAAPAAARRPTGDRATRLRASSSSVARLNRHCFCLQALPLDELLMGVAMLLLEGPAAQQSSLLSLGKNLL